MARTIELRVPKLGNFSDVPVVEVFIVAGKAIGKDEAMLSLESEKAVIEIPAPESGRVIAVSVAPGDTVSEGDLLGTMEVIPEPETAPASQVSRAPSAPHAAPEETALSASQAARSALPERASPAPPSSTQRISAPPPAALKEPGLYHATPSVRLLARELGADLAFVRGTGPKGRIRREDLSAYVKEKLAAPGRGAAGSGAPGREKPAPLDPETFRKFGGIEIVAASRIKRISGPRLAESWRTIPHVTQFDEADITELEEFRNRSKALLAKEDLKLTVLAFAIKAAVATLKAFPVFNSSLLPESGEFVMKKYYNIGFAVSTEAGLLVPCLKNADAKSLREIARELKELSTKASTGKLGFEDMSGASFTISSLGGIGGTGFTPIVNPPEVAILGLSRASMKPLWNEKTASFLPRLVLPFSLSYDHRAIDGAEGARFCRHFASLMGDMAALLM